MKPSRRTEVRHLRDGTPYVVEIEESVEPEFENGADAVRHLEQEELERRNADIEEALWREERSE